MSFVFRGARADLENGFQEYLPERRAVVIPIDSYLHYICTMLSIYFFLTFYQFVLIIMIGDC